jgi:hypothetical protein
MFDSLENHLLKDLTNYWQIGKLATDYQIKEIIDWCIWHVIDGQIKKISKWLTSLKI